jgi:hypothetical protein
MAVKTIVSAAVTVAVACAMQHMQTTGMKWAMSDLPRAELHTKDAAASGCGREFPGYFVFPGLKWDASWKGMESWNVSACERACNENLHCIAFTTHKPRHGRWHCNLYQSLLKEIDHRAQSFMRCVKGFECENGFQFTHAGAWKGGKQIDYLDDESKAECRLACYNDRGCVGFTYRTTKEGDTFCSHYSNAENKEGPTRDMRSNTYSKCRQIGDGPLASFEGENETEAENQTEAEEEAPDSKDEQSDAADTA